MHVMHLSDNAFVNILGRRGSGKGHLVQFLLNNAPLSGCPGIVMGQRLREPVSSAILSVTEYDPNLLQVWAAKMMRASKADPSQHAPWFIVLNNCLWNCTWHNDPCVRDLIMHRDVFKVTTVLSSNSLQRDLPESMFQCIDYTFLFKFQTHDAENNLSPLFHKLFRIYGSIAYSDPDAFAAAVLLLHPERHCIVIDHRNRSSMLIEF